MRQPPKPKPKSLLEAARVLRVFDALTEELERRFPSAVQPMGLVITKDTQITPASMTVDGVLAVAERIAARTED